MAGKSILIPRFDKLPPEVARQLDLAFKSINAAIDSLQTGASSGATASQIFALQQAISGLQTQIADILEQIEALEPDVSVQPSIARHFMFFGA